MPGICSNVTKYLVVDEGMLALIYCLPGDDDEEIESLFHKEVPPAVWERMEKRFGPRMEDTAIAENKEMLWPLLFTGSNPQESLILGHSNGCFRVWTRFNKATQLMLESSGFQDAMIGLLAELFDGYL